MPIKYDDDTTASMSLSFGEDELLTEEGTELTAKFTDSTGTKTETVVVPWSDDEKPEERAN
jgi:hypothetical protein